MYLLFKNGDVPLWGVYTSTEFPAFYSGLVGDGQPEPPLRDSRVWSPALLRETNGVYDVPGWGPGWPAMKT